MAARIGKYDVLAKLSTGGMAELYLAATTGPGGFRKLAAVKKVLPHIQAQREFARMFLDEARITAMLNHPGIAQVYELGDARGELFLAMEYVPGQDLSKIIKACRRQGQRVPPGFACLVVRDTCLALHSAHHFVDPAGRPSEVVHRDIAPKNIMVTYDGAVKVIDFGIALAQGRLETTAVGTVKGTANYMSPEQVQAKPLDGRSDLYSAGIVLHELLSGQRVFNGANDAVTLQQIVKGEVPPPRALNPKIPPGLSDVVMRAISRRRDDRYPSGREMARAIEAVSAGFLFDHEEAGRFMREMFQERLAQTRALFSAGDGAKLQSAASELREDAPSASAPGGRVPGEALTDEVEPQTSKVRAELVPAEKTVVVAAEDPSVLSLVASTLKDAGHSVIRVRTADDARKAWEVDQPALVVLDLKLDGDAFALCRELRGQPFQRHVPIVFLSSAGTLEERLEAIRSGGDDLIGKPFSTDELAARVQAHLDRAELLSRRATPRALSGEVPAVARKAQGSS